MSGCQCGDKESQWRVRFDPIRNIDQATGIDLIFNFNGVQVGLIDDGPYGQFLPWSAQDRFHEMFRCVDDGSYPHEDWSHALALLAAVDIENERAELERASAFGRRGGSTHSRL